jgi:hypothetical protein
MKAIQAPVITGDYVPANENGDCENMKMATNSFACCEQFDWPKNVFIIGLFMT